MAGKIKLGTPIKAWKDVKTGEIKTYKEWIKSELPEKGNKKTLVDMMIFKDELLPIYDID
jgi:uncharacterized protein YktB (UPF0637 family)